MSTYVDDFTRTTASGTGLGAHPQGKVYEYPKGTFHVNGTAAVASTTVASDAIAVIKVSSGDNDAWATVDNSGGDCLYFRVQDANNWLRARISYSTTTNTHQEYLWEKDNYATEYYWVARFDHDSTAASHTGWFSQTDWPDGEAWFFEYYGWAYTQPTVPLTKSYTHDHWSDDDTSGYTNTVADEGVHTHNYKRTSVTYSDQRQVYQNTSSIWHTSSTSSPGTGYTYTGTQRTVTDSTSTYYRVHFDQCIAGTVSEITEAAVASNVAAIRAVAVKNTIQIYSGTSATTMPTTLEINTTHNSFIKARLWGIGRGSISLGTPGSSNNSGTNLSSFTITELGSGQTHQMML